MRSRSRNPKTKMRRRSNMARLNSTIALIGTKGTGKSTFLLELLKASDKKKAIIFDMDDNEVFHQYESVAANLIPRVKDGNIFRVIDIDFEKVLDEMANFWNGLLVFDDATKYLSGIFPKKMRNLILASKQRNVDIVLTFHTFRCIHPDLFSLTNFLELFKTGERIMDIPSVKGKLPKLEEVAKLKDSVEKHPNKFYHKTIEIL